MRKVLLLAVAGTIVTGLASGASALDAPSAQAKKKCKIVVKIVHGHKRKVRVCHTVKPKALPTSVSVTLDPAHAATASITADTGATLTAGRVTLTVPAGAVSSTTSVTMTPVTRVSGLPGTVLGAVQFGPDGLQLAKPVQLTIDVSATTGLRAFSYSGSGTDFHLYPMKIEGGKVTLELTHFSGYGVGKGVPPPSVERLRTELNTVVKPKVDLARTKSGVFEQAAKLFSSWKKEVGLLPASERAKFAKDIIILEIKFQIALKRLADDEHADCVESHDLTGMKRIVDALWLAFFDVGLAETDAEMEYALQQIGKCERFELDFDSALDTIGAGRVGSQVRVKSLKLNNANHFSNEVPFDYVSFTFVPLPCDWATSTTVEKPFKATILDLDLGNSTGTGAQPNPKLEVFVGTASEALDYSCPHVPPVHIVTRFWSAIFAFHPGTSFTIDNWDSVTSSYVAHKEYTGTIAATTELTTFVLRHVPE